MKAKTQLNIDDRRSVMFRLPSETKRKFDIRLAIEGITQQQLLEEYVNSFISDNKLDIA